MTDLDVKQKESPFKNVSLPWCFVRSYVKLALCSAGRESIHYIVAITEFLRQSIFTTFQEKEKNFFFPKTKIFSVLFVIQSMS